MKSGVRPGIDLRDIRDGSPRKPYLGSVRLEDVVQSSSGEHGPCYDVFAAPHGGP